MRSLLLACGFFVLACVLRAEAPALTVGEVYAPFAAKDQHDTDYPFPPDTRLVLISFSMGTGKDTNGFLAKKGAAFLAAQKAVFVANIHGMPGIARTFAMPKMRKYPHRIRIADGEHVLDRYPQKDDHLTVLRLDSAGRITDISFVDPEKGLDAVFATKP
jgi:hypothetical protein